MLVVTRRARAGFGFAALAAASFGLSGALASALLDAGWSPAALVLCRIVVGALVLAGPGASSRCAAAGTCCGRTPVCSWPTA